MKEIKFAFKQSLPIFCGYIFLGISFGLLLQQASYNVVWAFFISLFVYAGSMQFVLVGLLTGGASVLTSAIVTLSVNCRHMVYGLSFLDKFHRMSKKYPYMVFSLTDETYSLLCSTKTPMELDENKTLFFISLLNHMYWILGSVLGNLLGNVIPFDITGIDFAMTALFVVIFVEQWLSDDNHLPAIIGMISGSVALAIFGPNHFILPALIVSVVLLIGCKNQIGGYENA